MAVSEDIILENCIEDNFFLIILECLLFKDSCKN